MRKKLDYEYCSASPILEWLGDKWALVVLLKLHENGVIRFNELYKTIPSISEKMLSTVLRSLVTDGLVGRKIYPSVPPKVEYYVSEFGETLIPHLERLKQWGKKTLKQSWRIDKKISIEIAECAFLRFCIFFFSLGFILCTWLHNKYLSKIFYPLLSYHA